MRKVLFALITLLSAVYAQSQDLTLYKKFWFIQGGDTLPYRMLFPENYDSAKTYPLVFFLHGAGERGSDNEKQLVHGSKLFLADSNRKKYPAIIVFPQCALSSYWSNVQMITEGERFAKRSFHFIVGGEPTSFMRMLIGLVDNIRLRYRIRQQQVYIMGLSMGGMGTFELVRRMPGVFAAAIPICGGAHPATASKLRETDWWIFHGGKDDVVAPAFSEKMVQALKRLKVPVRFTLYPNANHNSWDPAFAEPGLLQWLFSQRK